MLEQMGLPEILKISSLVCWMSAALITLFLKLITKKSVVKKKVDLEKMERMRKVKGLFQITKKVMIIVIIFMGSYTLLKYIINDSNPHIDILLPGILIPCLITIDRYISIFKNILKKQEVMQLEINKENR